MTRVADFPLEIDIQAIPIRMMMIPKYLVSDKFSLKSSLPTKVLKTTLRENKVDIMPKLANA